MPLKEYENIAEFGDLGTSYRLKVGETGRDHTTPRYYSNVEYGGYTTMTSPNLSVMYNVISAHRDSPETMLSRFVTPYERFIFEERMRSKLEGRIGASASLGSAVFAEGTESVRMAVDSLERFANIARAIRRPNFKRLRKAMKSSKRPDLAFKKAGGSWLEFSFGWAPLVGTVLDAMEATGADFPKTEVKASLTREYNFNIPERYDKDTRIESGRVTRFMKISYDATVTNPNTWLLGRLGLLNPAEWVWEAIPYSFFVDYFVNIGDLIHNMSKYAGVDMQHRYTTQVISTNHEIYYNRVYHGGGGTTAWARGNGKSIVRYTTPIISLYTPLAFNFHNPLTSSWQRGLNASSFLAQFFKGR